MDSVFAAFPKFLKQFGDNPDMREAFVFAAWRHSVGKQLSEHTSPTRLTGSKLSVAVRNRMWQAHLEDMASQILAKLNSELRSGTVKFIDFYIDEKALMSPEERSAISANELENQESVETLSEPAAAINDEELRKTFLLAAASCLARKDRLTKAD